MAIKKNGIMPFSATRMDLKIVIRIEVNQTEKEENIVSHFLHVKSKRNDKNELTYQSRRINMVAGGEIQGKGYLRSLGWTCT